MPSPSQGGLGMIWPARLLAPRQCLGSVLWTGTIHKIKTKQEREMRDYHALVCGCLISGLAWPAAAADLPFEARSALPPAARAFFSQLKPADFTPPRLARQIARYNTAQQRRYRISPPDSALGDGALPPAGYSQITLQELPQYFQLDIQVVDRDHSAVIDDGIDSWHSLFFSKQQRAAEARYSAGPTYPMPGHPQLRLAIPSRDSCMGRSPVGSMQIMHLASGQPIWQIALPEHSLYLHVDETAGEPALHYTLVEEEAIDSPRQCEVGGPVRRTTSRYALQCDAAGSQCSTSRLQQQSEEDCMSIGGCD